MIFLNQVIITCFVVNQRENGAELARFSYDSSGKRVQSDEAGWVVHYVYDLGGKLTYEYEVQGDANSASQSRFRDGDYSEPGIEDQVAGGTKSYIIGFDQTIVEQVGNLGGDGEVYYYHHDNLGSTTAITDVSRNVVMQQDYMPFGEDLYGRLDPLRDRVTDVKYTGQINDSTISLSYYNARYYDSEIGRFTREDTYRGELSRPQTLNLYVYVLNQPLKYIDPTGNNTSDHDFANAFMIATEDLTLEETAEAMWTSYSSFGRGLWNGGKDSVTGMWDQFNGLVITGEKVPEYLDAIIVADYYFWYGWGHIGEGIEGLKIFANDVKNRTANMSAEEYMYTTGHLMGSVGTDYLIGLGVHKGLGLMDDFTELSYLDDVFDGWYQLDDGYASVNMADVVDTLANDDVWRLEDKLRGRVIEQMLANSEYMHWFNCGQLDNGKFRVIDFQLGNTVVSLKSMDPRLPSYIGNKGTSKVIEYLDALNVKVRVSGNLANKVLDLRVPKGTMDLINIEKLSKEAARRNIKLKVKEF